jgi:micrococcal nuclease
MFRRAPILRLLPAMICLLPGSLACTPGRSPSPAVRLADGARAQPATVEHVVDGDTIELELDGSAERARLLGIDTPETVKPDAPVECFGPEASEQTKDLLPPGTKVLIQRDREARDRYGRLLVYVWRASDELFVNRSLVEDGYADVLSIEPNTAHRADLAAAKASARSRGAGMWAACPPP